VKTFLIGPVRGMPQGFLKEHVERLEGDGYEVHWPERDTNQVAASLEICNQNHEAIKAADVVHVIWDGKSQGCLFDIGVAFALGKKAIPITMPEASPGKSFQNMVREWASCV